ncbi:MAG TPA: 50S ribosomal protein L18 [Candidatus Norongarragalinales archaeon]|jgi:large subunit ribosomal protein L18|nr:50S ribosomal protein L18 [Candidatus Norongarragalinales archaeon]
MTKATGPLFTTHFRRRRAGKTDFATRLALLKSGQPRLIVRKTNKNVIVQLAHFDAKGDKMIANVTSSSLRKMGFPGKCNTPSAYLCGAVAAKHALKKGAKSFVLDIGRQTASNGSLLFAAAKGAIDAGLEGSFNEEKFPSMDRIRGKHLKPEVQEAFTKVSNEILKGAIKHGA